MALVKDLPLSRRQMVEIAKALARNPRILILDEATSALTAADVAKVFVVLKRLRAEGLALLYISHRMHEIAELADECTVFRNGSNVATYPAGTKSDDEVVEMMIGRECSHVFPPKPPPRETSEAAAARGAQPRLGATGCATFPSTPAPARSSASAGSTGRASANCCWRCSACCGASRARSASPARRRAVEPACGEIARIGMALIPEDRKTEGLMLPMSVSDNLSFAALERISPRRRHRPRPRAQARRRHDRASGDPRRRPRHSGRARSPAATSRKSSSPSG